MRNDDNKGVYVQFSDGKKTAEFMIGTGETKSKCVHGCKVINNNGFDEEELKQLRNYIDNEQDYIFSLAKTVNPMKAFMGNK